MADAEDKRMWSVVTGWLADDGELYATPDVMEVAWFDSAADAWGYWRDVSATWLERRWEDEWDEVGDELLGTLSCELRLHRDGDDQRFEIVDVAQYGPGDHRHACRE